MNDIKKVKEWREKSNKQFRLFNVDNRRAAFRISDDKFFQAGDRIITTNNEERLYKKDMRGVILWFYKDLIRVWVMFDNGVKMFVEMNDMDWN